MRSVKPPPLRTVHAYVPDGVPDGLGHGHCATCGLPSGNARHVLPAMDPGVVAVEARRLGEGTR